MSDLENLFEEQVVKLDIIGPDGTPFIGTDGEGWWITIAGPSHPAGFKAEEVARLRVFKQMTGKQEVDVADDYIERIIGPLVIRTLEWGPINQGGKPFHCTPNNVRALYTKSDLVRKQVEGFVYHAENFRKMPFES